MMDEKAKETIRKLLAMAERGGSEAEAEIAMTKVHAFLCKHNLTMADIETKKDSPKFQENTFYNYTQPWATWIWSGVSKLYFCDYWIRTVQSYGEVKKVHCVIGTPDNSEVVQSVSMFLIEYGEKLAKHLASSQPTGERRSWINSFLKGYGVRVQQRCKDEIAKAKAQNVTDESTGKDLIVTGLYTHAERSVEAYKVSQGIRLGKARRGQRARKADAYGAGQNAANSVSLKGNSGKVIT